MTPMLYASARWLTLDPLANKYYGISPYAFCANTPINFVDPDGNSWGKAFKVVKKISKTVKAGVSGGKKTKGGKSYRGESQVRKWNREEGSDRYESKVTYDVPEGEGAREKILDYEKNHAEELKSLNQLDPTKHIRP